MRPRAEDVFGLPRRFGTAEMLKKGSAAALASQPECAEEGGTGEIRPLRKRKRCKVPSCGKRVRTVSKKSFNENERVQISNFYPQPSNF